MNTKTKKLIKEIFIYLLMFCASLLVSYWGISLCTTNRVAYRAGALSARTWIFIFAAAICITAVLAILRMTVGSKPIKDFFKIFPEESSVDYLHLCLGTIIFFVLYMLTLSQPVDYSDHSIVAANFDFTHPISSLQKIAYPLWHILSTVPSRIFRINIRYTDSMVSALFNVFAYAVIRKIILCTAGQCKKYIADIVSFALMFVQPLYVPWFNENQFLGQSSPNIWHNPTNQAVRPFALLYVWIFYSMFKCFENGDKKNYNMNLLRLFAVNFISVLAKPSHAQAAIPATAVILLIMLVKTKGKSFGFAVRTAVSWVPAVLWMAFIFYSSFINSDTSSGNSIALSKPLFAVWAIYTNNIPVSILLIAGTPLLIFAFSAFKNNDSSKLLWFTIIYLIISILEYGLLAETGSRYRHGNFGWGYSIALSEIWVFSAGTFLNDITDDSCKIKIPAAVRKIITVLISLHFLFGIYYMIHAFQEIYN